MADSTNDQPGKPDITIQAPSDMPAAQQKAVQATAAWMTDDIARLVQQEPGGSIAKLIENSRGDQAELLRLVERNGQAFLDSLPRAVQDDIRAMMQQNMKNNNDDDDFRRRKKLEEEELYGAAAGIAGIRESNILEMGRGEGGGNISLSSSIDNMNTEQRFQYFDKASDMTISEWMGKSEAEQRKILENLNKDGTERLAKGNKEVADASKEILNDPKYGATPAERQKKLAEIKAAVDIEFNKDQAEANIAKLSPEDQAIARKMRAAEVDIWHGNKSIEAARTGTDLLNKGDIKGAGEAAIEGSIHAYRGTLKNLANNTATMENANMATASGQKAFDDAAVKTEKTLSKPMTGLDEVQKAEISNSVDAYTKASSQAHAQVAKQDHNASASQSLDLGDETPAPTQVAAIGGRKSIDIPNGANGEPIVGPASDMLAQLGAPMETKKAEEPELKPENQQPKAPKTTLET